MIITYDDAKKSQIDTGLEETATKLTVALNYGVDISIPNGFSRAGDIGNTLSALRTAKSTVSQAQTWLTKTNNEFAAIGEASKNRTQLIENKKIIKKDLLVK